MPDVTIFHDRFAPSLERASSHASLTMDTCGTESRVWAFNQGFGAKSFSMDTCGTASRVWAFNQGFGAKSFLLEGGFLSECQRGALGIYSQQHRRPRVYQPSPGSRGNHRSRSAETGGGRRFDRGGEVGRGLCPKVTPGQNLLMMGQGYQHWVGLCA